MTEIQKNMKKTLITLCAVLCAATLAAKDIKTLTLTTTPQMHCANCEAKIKNQLRFEKGVKRIETSVERQTVVIQYDADRTGSEQLIKSLSKIGYKAQPLKEAAKAAEAEKKSK